MKRTFTSSILFLALALGASTARANGRFPAASQLVISPSDPSTVLLRTTFGLLLSRDGGSDFRWICETVAGYDGEQDPAIAMLQGDAMAVASYAGLTVSTDGGCSFQETALGGARALDVAVEQVDPTHAVAIRVDITGGQNDIRVFVTDDSGATWTQSGTPLPTDFIPQTIDVAPSNPARLYVSGASTSEPAMGVIFTSDDRGVTFTRHEIDLAGDLSLFVAAIAPNDADRLYIRTYGGSSGSGSMGDRLLVSSDGGVSASQLASVVGSMEGFALSPDGTRIAIGGYSAGLSIGDAMTGSPAMISDVHVSGLTWSKAGLYVTAESATDGYIVGLTEDEGATFTPLFPALSGVEGPLTNCPASGSYANNCLELWPSIGGAIHADGGVAGDAGPDELQGVDPNSGVKGSGKSGGCSIEREASSPCLAELSILALGALAFARRRRR